ncbi:phage major capsid protein [Massilia sp. P8910]|uniref:phage major capsid protein n=1 Tax=Massilia antarctica TaxID=2765360 RepID=UPI001E52094C|nr:phage major capsid protein [Massilia antarctica]MCE3605828.1 phage major capsid protein [Massilia antarctica]
MSDLISKALDRVEAKMAEISTKADAEMKDLGKISTETKAAIESVGIEQRTLADRLLAIEQKASAHDDAPAADETVGAQFVKHAAYDNFIKQDGRVRTRIEVKNTVTNTIGNTFSERRPGIVEGAFRVFTIEDLLVNVPTSANAIDWLRENVFTNAAAETAEGAQKPESSITFTPGTMPVSTVAHWIKITRQLAMDNAALAAYITRRMVYGVDIRVENQLVGGNGVAPNISGLTLAGNFTAHGYTAAALTALGLSPTNRFDLIGKMIGDCAAADYPADVVILNTADWWTMRLAKDSQGRYLLGDPGSTVVPTLFGRPVVASNAMVAGSVWVGSLSQAATLHTREGIAVDLSDSDGDNFTKNLITIRAERRLALTVEKPAAARYGLLLPA